MTTHLPAATREPTTTSTSARVPVSPRCDRCKFVLPSYTASTALRCGLEYARANALMKKLRTMDFYPIVKADNACESWCVEDAPE